MKPEELRDIVRDFAVIQRRNKALGKCKIDELQVVAIDGIETSKSKVKQCKKCLSRVHSANAMPEYYHRFVAMMYVGGTFHTFLDATMLVPRDGEEKEEGELTGAKRLMEENHALLGHFADVIVVDALYFNAPFITLVLACGMDVVVRLKDESRKPYKEAEKSIRSGHYHAGKFFAKNAKGHNIEVEVADVREVEMENLEVANSETGEKEARNIRVLRFTEHDLKNPDEPAKIVWVATTSSAKASTIWKIMHARWGIENNGFHQISTYYHVKHLYCHDAVEQCFFLALIAFNMREAYLMLTRARDFPKSGLTRTDATDEFWDSLQEHPIKCPINIYRKKRRIKKRRAA